MMTGHKPFKLLRDKMNKPLDVKPIQERIGNIRPISLIESDLVSYTQALLDEVIRLRDELETYMRLAETGENQ